MKAKHGERGANLPEMAIVVGSLLLLICGVIDFGRAMYTYGFVAQTARQAARWAIVRGSQCQLLNDCNATSSQIQSYVQSLSLGPTKASAITATATWPSCPSGSSGNAPGCTVSVNVRYTYNFSVIPFLASVPITMSSTSQMVISQ